MNYRTQTNMLPNINERTRPLSMFVHLTKRTKFLVRVSLFNKRTFSRTVHKLLVERLVRLQPSFTHKRVSSFIDSKFSTNSIHNRLQ
ncbi:hypothetical protein Hanom_Chr11g00975871 [Helianthus anomalus]